MTHPSAFNRQLTEKLTVSTHALYDNLHFSQIKNIAGRLPENIRNSFVDLQSLKHSKRDRPKNSPFHWRLICYILIKNLYKFFLPLLAALK